MSSDLWFVGWGLRFFVRDWCFVRGILSLDLAGNSSNYMPRTKYQVLAPSIIFSLQVRPSSKVQKRSISQFLFNIGQKLWSVWQAGQLLCRLPTYMKLVPWHWVLRSGAQRGEKSLPHSDWWRLLAVWPVSGHFSCVYFLRDWHICQE